MRYTCGLPVSTARAFIVRSCLNKTPSCKHKVYNTMQHNHLGSNMAARSHSSATYLIKRFQGFRLRMDRLNIAVNRMLSIMETVSILVYRRMACSLQAVEQVANCAINMQSEAELGHAVARQRMSIAALVRSLDRRHRSHFWLRADARVPGTVCNTSFPDGARRGFAHHQMRNRGM
jgi:hypothetical protein